MERRDVSLPLALVVVAVGLEVFGFLFAMVMGFGARSRSLLERSVAGQPTRIGWPRPKLLPGALRSAHLEIDGVPVRLRVRAMLKKGSVELLVDATGRVRARRPWSFLVMERGGATYELRKLLGRGAVALRGDEQDSDALAFYSRSRDPQLIAWFQSADERMLRDPITLRFRRGRAQATQLLTSLADDGGMQYLLAEVRKLVGVANSLP